VMKSIGAGLFELVRRQVMSLISLFLDLNIFEKGIVLSTFLSMGAVISAVGKYYIFERWFYINNPLAVHLIAVVVIMVVTSFYYKSLFFLVRILLNGYYLFWVFLIQSRGLMTEPYQLTFGYYFNIAVPLLYIILSVASHIAGRKS
jgi:hypothetical protein